MEKKSGRDPVPERQAQVGELCSAWRALQRATRDMERLSRREYGRLAEIDPDHPLYVRPGSATHWHVRRHPDANVQTTTTIFHALRNAAADLENAAELVSDVLGAARTDEEFGLLRTEYAAANAWGGMAWNAKRLMEGAEELPFERAPRYHSMHPDQDRRLLLEAAKNCVEAINDGGPPGFRMWACVDPECVLLREDDDDA